MVPPLFLRGWYSLQILRRLLSQTSHVHAIGISSYTASQKELVMYHVVTQLACWCPLLMSSSIMRG